MTIFEEIKEGDRIVVREHGDWWGRDKQLLKIVTVTKVTATQLTAGGIRFLRRNGYQFGRETRGAARIMGNGCFDDDERLMTPEEAEVKNREIKRVLDHKKLAYRIREVKFIELPYETLLKLAEVLGMEAPDDNP
jgi:hypothetical protein